MTDHIARPGESTNPLPTPPTTGGSIRRRLRLADGDGAAEGALGTTVGRSAAHRLFPRTGPAPSTSEVAALSASSVFGRRDRTVSANSHPAAVSPGAGGRDPEFLKQLRGELAEHAMALGTRRSYAGQQAAWEQWCRESGIDPAAATHEDVAHHLTWYLLELDEAGNAVRDARGDLVASVATSTLQVRLSAIDKAFETAGRDRPGLHREVKTLMEGVRRLYGVAPSHAKQPVLLADLRRMVASLQGPRPQLLRDLVLTRVRRQTQATPGQLARLRWADVDMTGVDAYLLLPPERRAGPRPRVRLRASYAPDRCPVTALRQLRELSRADGAAFVFTGPAGSALEVRPLTRGCGR